MAERELVTQFSEALADGIVRRWYPLVIDKECGGYFTNMNFDWSLPSEQEKMIVTQARHIWTLSKLSAFMKTNEKFLPMATHGYEFLRDHMWDGQYGGFYQIRNRVGGMSDVNMWRDEKRAYGCAFAIYGLAALARESGNAEVLGLAQRAYRWVEEHSFDPKSGGYFQFLTREGKPFDRSSSYATKASDANEVGFKDQNSSIHLLEAYTELFHVWKSPELRKQLEGLLVLIRDTIVSKEGCLRLFFHPDWTPVSFRDSSAEERKKHFGLDHVSFGHDYETAFLMLEASFALGLADDVKTLAVAKRMLDHALRYGFDESVGGFYDGGYYFKGDSHCSVVQGTKNWWAQAEGLNALLLFSRIFPEEKKYEEYFRRQWNYVKSYILDPVNGDWYEGGIDKEPQFKTGPKSHIWKCTYHTGRALMNCIQILEEGKAPRRGNEIFRLVEWWKKIAHTRH